MRLIILFGFLGFHAFSFAQFDQNYTPLPAYTKSSMDKASNDLIADLKKQTVYELKHIKTKKPQALERIYKSRLNMLLRLVEQQKIIRDDSLEHFVASIMNNIVSSNHIDHKPGKVLIVRETAVNALCYGEGTILITLGLLSKIVNEGQLAFTLAHELAHFEMDHVKNNILVSLEEEVNPLLKSEIENLNKGEITEEGLDRIKTWMYSIGQFSRNNELKADSLGLKYFKEAGYPEYEAISLLALLDSAQVPKYKLGNSLFQPLNFTRYPFQSSWLKPRLSIYAKRRFNNFIVPIDSLRSHPEYKLRKSALNNYHYDLSQYPVELDISYFTSVADFELIEAAYQAKEFDRCLHFALQLKSVYPKNSYINTIIGRILTTICETKMEGLALSTYVNPFTENYPPELRTVNNFLYNLMAQEIGEIAFNFLNQQDNFDNNNEESYFLLWKICKLTQRTSVKEKVKESYLVKFPKGIFAKQMKG